MFQLRKLLSQNIIKTILKLTPNIKNAFILAICCLERRQGLQAGYLWNKKLLYSGFKKGRLIYSDSSLNDRVNLQPGTGKGELIFRKIWTSTHPVPLKLKKISVYYIFPRSEVFSNAPGNFSGELGSFTEKDLPMQFVLTTSLIFPRIK